MRQDAGSDSGFHDEEPSVRANDRRLTMADLMVLIAATGLGLGCFVFVDDNLYGGARFVFGIFRAPDAWDAATILNRAQGIFAMAMTAFGGWTLALPILACRRPRSIRIRLLRGAGLDACLAATSGLAAVGIAVSLALLARWSEGRTRLPPNFWGDVPIVDAIFIFSAVAVGSNWLVRLATGRWRPRPEILDRLGRFVGVLWLLAGLTFATRLFLG